jgi:hypothetical protein
MVYNDFLKGVWSIILSLYSKTPRSSSLSTNNCLNERSK